MGRGKKKARGTFSTHGNDVINFYGMDEQMEALRKAQYDMEEFVTSMMKASMQVVFDNLQGFIAKHRRTGHTEESLYMEIARRVTLYTGRVGFALPEGSQRNPYRLPDVLYTYEKDPKPKKPLQGLPALFLDIGTPHQEPTFFVYYAFKNAQPQIRAIQQKMLDEYMAKIGIGDKSNGT